MCLTWMQFLAKEGRWSPVLAEILGADGLIVTAVVVIVLLFGGTKLPKLARGLGSASHEFKKGMEEGDAEKGEAGASKGEDKTSGPIHPT